MANEYSLLLDPTRLAVAGSVATSARTSAEIAEISGLPSSDVITALGELCAGGLVQHSDGAYRLDADQLRELAGRFAEYEVPMDDSIGFGMTDAERDVLRRYFSGRVLHSFPSSRTARLVVLERLSLEFDPGIRVPEAEVNVRLHEFHRDTAALRRAMVDEGFLDREHRDGQTWYFRAGGRVPLG